MPDVHPFALRDALNPVCPTCGKPARKTALPVSRRGNFRHGATVTTVHMVGAVCACPDRPEPAPVPCAAPADVPDPAARVARFFAPPDAEEPAQ